MRPIAQTPLPTLIAWLSLCLLAAAWGHTLDEQWQVIWAQAGAFGMVTAVGLGVLDKARTARNGRLQDQQLAERLNHGLSHLVEHSSSVEAINAAVRRLTEHAAKKRRVDISRAQRGKNLQSQLLGDYPLRIVPIEEHEVEFDPDHPQSIGGCLRQISTQAVSFEHEDAFNTRVVLLTFRVGDDEQLSFVVEAMWTQQTVSGYVSGGTVLAVGVPDPNDALYTLDPAETVV